MEQKEKDYYTHKANKAVYTAYAMYALLKDKGEEDVDSQLIYSVWYNYPIGSKRHPEGKEIKCGEVRFDVKKSEFVEYCYDTGTDKVFITKEKTLDKVLDTLFFIIDGMRERHYDESDIIVRFQGGDTAIPVCHNKEGK